MGHLLSHPVTSKFTNRRGNAFFRVGAAEMQGYRVTMEDTHNICLDVKKEFVSKDCQTVKRTASASPSDEVALSSVLASISSLSPSPSPSSSSSTSDDSVSFTYAQSSASFSSFSSSSSAHPSLSVASPDFRDDDSKAILASSSSSALSSPPLAFFAVYDGHSGGACSEFACVDLPRRLVALPDPFDVAAVSSAVVDCDAAFCSNVVCRTHGSTACFLLIQPRIDEQTQKRKYKMLVGNLGDSRCLVLTQEGRIRFATQDHKPDNEVEARRIRAAGGTVNFGRVDGELAMSRSLGDYNYKGQAHLSHAQQKVIAVPDIDVLELVEGEKIVLMCDGLVEKASNEQIAQLVENQLQHQRADPCAIVLNMIDFSLERGSRDNMSAMLILLEDGSSYVHKDEYLAGSIASGEDDRKFMEAYVAFARSKGIEPAQCLRMARTLDGSLTRRVTSNDALLLDK